MTALLIKNGLVIDGTGAPGRLADVRIRDGRIDEIAPDLAAHGERIIDAAGAVVAPGFIDSHTHFDATIYWDPRLDPMAQHGVTTVVAGNCSLGLAPMRAEDRTGQIDTFSYIEDMPADLLNSVIPWDWEKFPDYARSFDRRPLGLNMVTFAGHSQIRAYVMGEAAWERAATPAEIARITAELEEALKAGANGLSFSLFDKDRRGRLVPSRHADDAELDALCAKLAEYDAVLQFIPGHSTEAIIADLEWVGGFLARHKVPGLYNALVHLDAEPDRSHRTIACLEALHAKGAHIWAMVSPRPFELRVDFEQSICFLNVPAWNELVQAPAAEKRRLVSDPAWRERARADADGFYSPMFPFHQPEQIRIIAVARPELGEWVGRSLADLAAARGGPVSDVLADWAIENDFATAFLNPVANSDPVDVARLLKSPVTFISGGDAGAHLQMFCGAGEGTLLLTRFVRERGDLSLAEAIHALTGQQAELLGMTDRGTLEPGKAADLTIFALDELSYATERLVSDLPGGRSRFTRDPGGFRYTIVNGVVVQDHGRSTDDLPGSWVGAARQSRLVVA
jgi:N-acyl-D-aspartate/D-glutamate deacylase